MEELKTYKLKRNVFQKIGDNTGLFFKRMGKLFSRKKKKKSEEKNDDIGFETY